MKIEKDDTKTDLVELDSLRNKVDNTIESNDVFFKSITDLNSSTNYTLECMKIALALVKSDESDSETVDSKVPKNIYMGKIADSIV